MEKTEILQTIKKHAEDHKVEIEGCQLALDEIQSDLTKEKKPDMLVMSKLAVLKDKMIFHKAAKAVLEDLLKVINER